MTINCQPNCGSHVDLHRSDSCHPIFCPTNFNVPGGCGVAAGPLAFWHGRYHGHHLPGPLAASLTTNKNIAA